MKICIIFLLLHAAVFGQIIDKLKNIDESFAQELDKDATYIKIESLWEDLEPFGEMLNTRIASTDCSDEDRIKLYHVYATMLECQISFIELQFLYTMHKRVQGSMHDEAVTGWLNWYMETLKSVFEMRFDLLEYHSQLESPADDAFVEMLIQKLNAMRVALDGMTVK